MIKCQLRSLACFGAFAGISLFSARATETITTPYAGMTRHSVTNATVNGRSGINYEVIVLDLLDHEMSFYLTPSNGALPYETTRQTTKDFASAYATEVAINAHFFDTGLSPETNDSGIAATNGDVYSPFETVGGLTALNISAANFAETVTGVSGGTTFASSTSVPYTAIASGSMQRREGAAVNVGAVDYRVRTQVGVTRNGVLRSGAVNALPNGTITVSKGLLDLAGCNDTVGAVTMGGVAGVTPEIRTGAGVLTIGGTYTYSATNNGLGALVKGTLDLGPATRTFTIGDSTNAAVDAKIEAAVQGSAGVGMIKTGAGTMELAGNVAFSGLLTVNNGVLLLSGPNSTLGAITLGGTASVSAILDTGTQSKVLLTAASVTGSFSSLQLPSPPAGTVYSVSVTATQVLLNVSPGNAAQSWLASKGLPLDSSLSTDLDGDGNFLLAEYALGGEPQISDSGLTFANEQGGALQVSFLLNTTANDITYIVEGSSNLSAWTTLLSKINGAAWIGPATYSQGTAVSNLAPMTVTDTATTTPRFLRLRLTKP